MIDRFCHRVATIRSRLLLSYNRFIRIGRGSLLIATHQPQTKIIKNNNIHFCIILSALPRIVYTRSVVVLFYENTQLQYTFIAVMTRNLTINGELKQTEAATVLELLVIMGLEKQAVAVEVNREVIPKRLHGDTPSKTATPSNW